MKVAEFVIPTCRLETTDLEKEFRILFIFLKLFEVCENGGEGFRAYQKTTNYYGLLPKLRFSSILFLKEEYYV